MNPLRIEKVLLLFPRKTEKRWENFSFPPSILFLVGGLEKKGFSVDFSYLEIPSLKLSPSRKISDYQVIGITVFDDFFLEISEFVSKLPSEILVALGGITPTMAPMETFKIIERANVVFAGEGECAFPTLLDALRKGEILDGPWGLRLGNKIYFRKGVIREDLSLTPISFSVFSEEFLQKGLELVVSRGCPRSCIFCTHVHGRIQRQTPPERIKNWLQRFKDSGGKTLVNLADDDILLYPEYAKKVFSVLKQEGFSIWGIQTSMDSLLREDAFYAIMEAPFVSEPVVWIGTDVFISSRAKRLAKKAKEDEIERVVKKLDSIGVRNYHYWILSDCLSTLDEFAEEFSFVASLVRKYKSFHLLPNSPFLIPYPYTPSYKRALLKCRDKIVYRAVVRKNGVEYPIVKYEKPQSFELHELLNPEKSLIPWIKPGEFLEYLRNSQIEKAASMLVSLGVKLTL